MSHRFQFPLWARRDRLDRELASMRSPASAPDFSSAILDRVHAERPFLASSGRRWRIALISTGVLALVGLAVGGLAFGRWSARVVPGLAQRAPLAEVVGCVVDETSRGLQSLARSGRSIVTSLSAAERSERAVPAPAAYLAAQVLRPALRAMIPYPDLDGVAPAPIQVPAIAARFEPPTLISALRLPMLTVPQSPVAPADEPADLADQVASSIAGEPFQTPSVPR